MKPNIGIMNSLLRITAGFTMVAWATAKLVKRPWRDSYLVVAVLGGMKIGEGITRFCPLTALYQNYATTGEEKSEKEKEETKLMIEV